MSREAAITRALHHLESGAFKADLAGRIAVQTESQNPERTSELLRYLEQEMRPAFESMRFTCAILHESTRARAPFLYAERIENAEAVTVLGYGHGRRHARARPGVGSGAVALDPE